MRGDVVVSNKLWWEFWPDESPAQEISGSLRRMGLEHVDLIYSEQPPADVPLAEVIGMITGLIAAGQARSWGTLNWSPALLSQACDIAAAAGVPLPCATQPPYSLIRREVVEDPDLAAVAAEPRHRDCRVLRAGRRRAHRQVRP